MYTLPCIRAIPLNELVLACLLLHRPTLYLSLYRSLTVTQLLCNLRFTSSRSNQSLYLISFFFPELFPFPLACAILFLTHCVHLSCFVVLQLQCNCFVPIGLLFSFTCDNSFYNLPNKSL